MGLFRKIYKRFISFWIFFLIVVLLPGLPPRTTFPLKAYNVTTSKDLKGSLELNNLLDNGERLLVGRVYGPEALVARKNEVYTTIHGGEVIKITQNHITHVAKFGQPCEGIFEEHKCGRPLGLAFDTIGNNLIVADAYYGIWQVDLANGKKKNLISPHQVLDGNIKRPAKTFNSVAVDKRGDIYWTDSSSDFTIEDGILATLANPSGRLFFYDRSKNESKVLIDQLAFANGVALSPNEDFLIVAETCSSRLLKYHLKGLKRGQQEIFLDGLPGLPDNLSPDEEGLWVPLVASRDAEHPQLFQVLSNFPTVRLFLLRLHALAELPFRVINNAFPNQISENVLHFIGNFESMKFMHPKRTTILRVDWNGVIQGSLHGFDKSVAGISHVLELDDSLLLGSPFNKYLGKVKLPKKPQIKVRNVRYESGGENIKVEKIKSEKPVVMEPTIKPMEPTTTTSKPTTTTTTTQKPTTTTTQKATTSTTQKPTTTTPKSTTTTTQIPTTTTTQKPTTAKQKPTITTTHKPVTTQKPVTTTQKPPTTTTTPKPTTTTTTQKPMTAPPTQQKIQQKTSTQKSETVTEKPILKAKKEPAPIEEKISPDTKLPKKENLKVIKRGGEQGEF